MKVAPRVMFSRGPAIVPPMNSLPVSIVWPRNLGLAGFLVCSLFVTRAQGQLPEPTVLRGHHSAVLMAAFAQQGQRIVTVSSDETARLWNSANGMELVPFRGHTGPVYCLAVSGDGRTLVTGAQDNTVRVWDLPLTAPVLRIPAHDAGGQGLVMSPDGRFVVSIGFDKVARLWDSVQLNSLAAAGDKLPAVANRETGAARSGHLSDLTALHYRADGNMFATADVDGEILLWSPFLDSPMGRLGRHRGGVTSLAFHPNNQFLLSAGKDGSVRTWQLPAPGTRQLPLTEAATSMLLVPGQLLAVVATADKVVRLIDLSTGQAIRELSKSELPITKIALSPNAATLAVADESGRIRFASMADGKEMGTIGGHTGPVRDLAFLADNVRMLSVGDDGSSRLWQVPAATIPVAGHTIPMKGLASSASGQFFVTGSDDKSVRIWNAVGQNVRALTNHQQPITSVAVRTDDQQIASADAEGTVGIWNAADGASLGNLLAHTGPVTSVEFDRNQPVLWTGGADGNVKRWQLPLVPPRASPGHAQPVKSVAVSPDGRIAYSGSTDQTVRAWDLANGQPIRAMADSNLLGPINSVVVSPDGALVAAGGATGFWAVWTANDGVMRHRRRASPMAIYDLAFSPDGSRLMTVSQDQQMRVWKLAEPVKEFANDGAPYEVATSSADGRRFAVAGTANGKPAVFVRDRENGQVLATVVGHEGAITSIALNRAGNRLVTGSVDKTLRIWNLDAAGAELRMLPGLAAPAIAVAISDDGAMVFSSVGENQVRQWNMADGTEVRQFMGHTAPVRSIAIRGNQLFSAADDGTLRIWDANTGAVAQSLTHGSPIRVFDVSLAGKAIVTGAADRSIKCWSGVDGSPIANIPPAASDLIALQLSLDSRQFATVTADGIRSFELDGRLLEHFESMPVPLKSIVGYSMARGLLACRADGRIDQYRVSAEQAVAMPDAETQVLCLTPDGQRVIASGAGKVIRIWPMNEGRVDVTAPPRTLSVAQGRVTDLNCAADGSLLAATTEDKFVCAWEMSSILASTGDVAPKWKWTANTAVRGVALSAREPRLAACCDDGSVLLWNLQLGQLAERFTQNQQQWCLAFAANGSLVSGGQDSTLRTWTPAILGLYAITPNGEPVQRVVTGNGESAVFALTRSGASIARWKADGSVLPPLVPPAGPISSLALSPDSGRLATVSTTGGTTIWNLRDGSSQPPFELGMGISSAEWTRDGTELIVTDGKPRIRFVAAESGLVSEEAPSTAIVTQAVVTGNDGRQFVAMGAQLIAALSTRSLQKIWREASFPSTAAINLADGVHALIARGNGQIQVKRLADGQIVRTLEGHTDQVTELSLVPNGPLAWSGSRDKSVRVWNLDSGALVRSQLFSAAVRSISISADGLRAAIGLDDGTTEVVDVSSGASLQTFVGHQPGPTWARWHSDNQSLISAASDKSMRVEKISALRSWLLHSAPILDMTLTVGGGQVITAGADGRVLICDANNGQLLKGLAEAVDSPQGLSLRPDGQRLAVGTRDGVVRVWNLANNELLQSLNVPSAVRATAWSRDGTRLAVACSATSRNATTGSQAGSSTAGTANNPPAQVTIFGGPLPPTNPQPGNELVLHQQLETTAAVSRMAWDSEGRSVWAMLDSGAIEVWAYASPTFVRRFDHGGPVYAVVVSRDGSTIVSGSADQTVRIWDARTGQQRAQMNGHVGPIHALALSPDESTVVSSAADRTVRVWDVSGGRQLKQLATFEETIYSLAVHPNGQTLAAAGSDRKIHLVNLGTGATERVFEGHTDYVHSVTFNSAGNRLLSYGYAGNLKVWDLATGTAIFAERIGRVGNTAVYGPENGRVVLANGDGTARIVELPVAVR